MSNNKQQQVKEVEVIESEKTAIESIDHEPAQNAIQGKEKEKEIHTNPSDSSSSWTEINSDGEMVYDDVDHDTSDDEAVGEFPVRHETNQDISARVRQARQSMYERYKDCTKAVGELYHGTNKKKTSDTEVADTGKALEGIYHSQQGVGRDRGARIREAREAAYKQYAGWTRVLGDYYRKEGKDRVTESEAGIEMEDVNTYLKQAGEGSSESLGDRIEAEAQSKFGDSDDEDSDGEGHFKQWPLKQPTRWQRVKKSASKFWKRSRPALSPRMFLYEWSWYFHASAWSFLSAGLLSLAVPGIGPLTLLLGSAGLGAGITSALTRWWWFLVLGLGGNSMALVLCLWTFTVACIASLVTYATTKVAQRRFKQEEADQVKQGIGSKLGEVADAGLSAASTFLPSFDGRTLSNVRNVVSLMRDLPLLLKALTEWWRIFTFRPKKAIREVEYSLRVVVSDTKVYTVRGLSGLELCSDVIVDGFGFVATIDGERQWLDMHLLSNISLKAVGGELLMVRNGIKLSKVDRILTRTIAADATIDMYRRTIKPVGLPDIGDTTAHGVASLATQVATQQAIHNLANPRAGVGASQPFVRGGTMGGTAKPRFGPGPPTTFPRAYTSVTSSDDFPDDDVGSLVVKGALKDGKKKKAVKQAKADNKDEREKLSDSDSEKGKEKDSHPILSSISKIVGDEDTEEHKQDFGADSARELAIKAREWVEKNAYFSWYWYLIAFGGVAVLAMLGVGFYLVKKRKSAEIEVDPEVKQSTILKYEVDEDTQITKFQKGQKWFAYKTESFNALAKGKEPGEIISVPVEFMGKNGKTFVRRINAVVSDDGQVVQAFKPQPNMEMKHHAHRRKATHTFNLGLYTYQVKNDELIVEANAHDSVVARSEHMAAALSSMAVADAIRSSVEVEGETKQSYEGGEKEEVRPPPQDYETTPQAKKLLRLFEDTSSLPADLKQAKQSFHDIEYNRHVYAISYVNEHVATGVLVPYVFKGERVAAIWCPKHYKNNSNLKHGSTYFLNNMVRVEPSTQFIWNGDWATVVEDAYDSMLVPLTRAYAHMSMANQFAVLKDGEHTLWLHGISPRTKKPIFSKVEAVKSGNKIKYVFDNDYGFCGATLSLDQDNLVIVGMHVEGNSKTKHCTASAVTPEFVKLVSRSRDQAF